MLGSLGGPEIILIFVVALIVFGPKRLPEIGRKVGEVLRELRRATGDFRSSMEREIGFDPVTGVEQARKARRDILSSVSDPIKDVAQGTIGAVRDARRQADALIRAQQAVVDEPASANRPASPYPPSATPEAAGQRSLDFDAGAKHGSAPAASPVGGEGPGPEATEAGSQNGRSVSGSAGSGTKGQNLDPSGGGPVG